MGQKYPKPKDVGIGQITEAISFQEIDSKGKTQNLAGGMMRIMNDEKEIKGIALLKNSKVVIAFGKVTEGEEGLEVLNELYLYDCKPINIKKREIEIDLMIDIDGEKVQSLITSIIQLSSGNFIVVAGQFYVFDPENIDNGPVKVVPIPRQFLNIGKFTTASLKNFCEISPGKLICNSGETEAFYQKFVLNDTMKMLLFDANELEKEPITIFTGSTITFMRPFPSKLNEDYVYTDSINEKLLPKIRSGADLTKDLSVIKSVMTGNHDFMEIPAIIQVWKKEDFFSESKSTKYPKGSIKISDHHRISDVCDYDKGRILVDNCSGVYIVDIEEQKVLAKFTYGNLIKDWVGNRGGVITVLKNGNVVRSLNGVVAGIDLFNEKVDRFSSIFKDYYSIFLDGKYLLRGTNEFFTLYQFFP